jgi:hypothetical protein
MIPTEYKVDYNSAEAYFYILTHIETGMKYAGISKQHPDDYVTSSKDVDLRKSISENKITRDIVKCGPYEEMITIEKQYLLKHNAANNPLYYNKSNGISKNKKTVNPKKMYDIGQSIMRDHSYQNINAEWIDINKSIDKNGNGVLDPSDPLNDLGHIQVKVTKLKYEHVSVLKGIIDENHGQFENIEQDFLVVILENRKYKNKPKKDYVIGGAHTREAIITSEYGFKMRVLRIPESVHSDWCDAEIKLLAMGLNPRDKIKREETDLETIAKTISDGILDGTYVSMKSDQVKDIKNTLCHTSAEKQKVTKLANKMIEEATTVVPTNIIDYSGGKEKDKIDKIVNDFNEKPKSTATKHSTGKFSMGDLMIKLMRPNDYKNILCVIHHPNQNYKDKWDNEYAADFERFKKVMSVMYKKTLKIKEMPFTRQEDEE